MPLRYDGLVSSDTKWVIGTIIATAVALGILFFTMMDSRFDSVETRIDETNDRITRLEDRVNARFDRVDTRLDRIAVALEKVEEKQMDRSPLAEALRKS